MTQKVGLYLAIGLALIALLLGGFALVEGGNDVVSMGLHPGSTSNVSGALVVSGNLQAGTDSLYMLGHASAGQQVVCGTTGILTYTTDVTVSALTSVSAAVVSQITVPNATASMIHVAGLSTNVITIDTLEADYTAGTTGADAYYCAIGAQ